MKTIVARIVLAIGFWCIFLTGCVSKVDRPPADKWGCQPPSPAVFKKVGVDLNFAQSTFGKVVVGTIDVKAKPEVVNLASQAATDAEIVDYMRCLAINRDHYTPEQATYLQEMISIVATKPTAVEFIEWKKQNPFPGGSPKAEPSVSIEVPSGWTFQQTATVIAKLGKNTVKFTGLTDEELHLEVRETRLQAKTHQKLLEALGSCVIGKFPKYTVAYEEPIFEIKADR